MLKDWTMANLAFGELILKYKLENSLNISILSAIMMILTKGR